MLKLSEQVRPHPAPTAPLRTNYRYFCRLFEDMITEGLCCLRRSELHASDALSCSGCSKDIIMRSRVGRRNGICAG